MNNRIYQSPDLYTVVSNRLVRVFVSSSLPSDLESPQLTSLYSLQSSLDTLRVHRPDYTPRTGFVWPIMDPSLADDSSKKRGADGELPSVDSQHDESAPPTKREVTSVLNVSKKQQNNTLLLNAMKTTAVHSNTSFSTRAFETRTESAPPETPHARTGMRSSATPAPTATRGGTPKVAASAPAPQEPSAKVPAGGGKKKRKSEYMISAWSSTHYSRYTPIQRLPFELQ